MLRKGLTMEKIIYDDFYGEIVTLAEKIKGKGK